MPLDSVLLTSIERDVDTAHLRNPALLAPRSESIPELLDQGGRLVHQLLAGVSGIKHQIGTANDRLLLLNEAMCQAIAWLMANPTLSIVLHQEHLKEAIAELLSSALTYGQVSSIYPALYRGFAREVTIDKESGRVSLSLPGQFLVFYASVMRNHNVDPPEIVHRQLIAAIHRLLPVFRAHPWAPDPGRWREAVELTSQASAADWEFRYAGDLGGYTLEELRRFTSSFRLWNNLAMAAGYASGAASLDTLRSSFVLSAGVGTAAAEAIIREMTYTGKDRKMSPSLQPLIPVGERLHWSPMSVLYMHPERAFWRRLLRRNVLLHDALSSEREIVPFRRLRELVAQYDHLVLLENLKMLDGQGDIDIILYDKRDDTLLMVEVKNPLPPLTLTEFFHADENNLVEGTDQVLKALEYLRTDPGRLLGQIRAKYPDHGINRLGAAFGAVLSNWTLGTGTADRPELGIRVINVAMLDELLRASKGKLIDTCEAILAGHHLVKVVARTLKIKYASYEFLVEFTG